MMFKWKSADRPSTPKLSSVALPTSPQLNATIQYSYYQQIPPHPTESNNCFGAWFQKSEKQNYKPPMPTASTMDRFATSFTKERIEREGTVVYKPPHPMPPNAPLRSRSTIVRVPSKAAKEIEAEKREEMQRMQEQSREAQPQSRPEPRKWRLCKFIWRRARTACSLPAIGPLKSCLKNSPQSKSYQPSPPAQDFREPPSHTERLRRQESSVTSYHSDTEQYRPYQKSTRRSQTYPQTQTQTQSQSNLDAWATYPWQNHERAFIPAHTQPLPDPIIPPSQHSQLSRSRSHTVPQDQQTRSRHNSFSASAPVLPIKIDKTRYRKAVVKEVPMKAEAIALNWQLVDYETRKSKGKPALYFDTAFDPRIQTYEVQVYRNTGDSSRPKKLDSLTREEETQPASTHTTLTEMVIYHNGRLGRWPIYLRHPQGLRCIDVFRGIYDTFSIPLTPDELAEIGPEYIERCKGAFNQRCDDGPMIPGIVRSKGICRIDLLKGRRMFKGLTQWTGPDSPGKNCWKLELEGVY